MANGPIDRRGFIRIPFNTEIEINIGEGVIRSDKGINVSMSGLRLSSVDTVLTPGISCLVSIILYAVANAVPIEARGRNHPIRARQARF
jgi:hypothetical protein